MRRVCGAMEKSAPNDEPLFSGTPDPNVVIHDEEDGEALCDITCGGATPIEDYTEIECKTQEQADALMVGLSSDQAAEREKQYGKNEIPQKVVKWYTILLKQFTSSMAIMIELALILAAAVQEWEDFAIIATLLAINAAIGFYEEWEAMKKVDSIKSALSPMCTVKRDGEFSRITE